MVFVANLISVVKYFCILCGKYNSRTTLIISTTKIPNRNIISSTQAFYDSRQDFIQQSYPIVVVYEAFVRCHMSV